MRAFIIKALSIFTEAKTGLTTGQAIVFTTLLVGPAVLTLWRRTRNRTLRACLILLVILVCGFAGFGWYLSLPVLQNNELDIATEGQCTATKGLDSGDIRIESGAGLCMARQVNNQLNTYAKKNRFTANFTVRNHLSTPGTGFEVIDDNGEVRQLVVRERGFNVGLCWRLEVSERNNGGAIQSLYSGACIAQANRPEHVVLTVEYDGAILHVESKFMFALPQAHESETNPLLTTIPHPLSKPQKILALITNISQNADDRKGFDCVIFSYWWQKHDPK